MPVRGREREMRGSALPYFRTCFLGSLVLFCLQIHLMVLDEAQQYKVHRVEMQLTFVIQFLDLQML